MLSSFGYTEMLIFGFIALMLFGSKLPDVARNFGRSYRDIRRKVEDMQREFREWDKPDPNTPSTSSFLPMAEDEPSRSSPAAPKFSPPVGDDD
jgi:sec-independent protein translocase protein TatA